MNKLPTITLERIHALLDEIAALDPALRPASCIYIEGELVTIDAVKPYPTELLNYINASHVGARFGERPRPVLAVSETGLARLLELVETGASTTTEQQVLDELSIFADLRLPNVSDVLRMPSTSNMPTEQTWEAVFHPTSIHNGVRTPISTATLERWCELVTRHGGEVYHDYVRTGQGLTYVPTRLPRKAVESMARFNALRTLQPIAPLDLRA